jgi:5'-phosphate synthase pdxT subunit
MGKIGILALQGAVREHAQALKKCGFEAVAVKTAEDLAVIDGLILPGGESTTMRRLMDRYDLVKPLKRFVSLDKPVFGTCAGLILMAAEIEGEAEAHLGVLDVKVRRNSFGRQIASFEANLDIRDIGRGFPGVFIRAPHITEAGSGVDVLCRLEERIVMVRQNNLLACSFHPELTEDSRIMSYFVKMVRENEAVARKKPVSTA